MNETITEELMVQFREELFLEEKSGCTVTQYLRDLRALYAFLPADKHVSKERTIRYKEHLLETCRTAASVNTKLAAINKFLGFIDRQDCCVKSVKTQRRLFCAQEKELTRDEYFRLLAAAQSGGNKRLYLLMQTICGTGIRVSELKWVTVEAVKRNRVTVTAKGKTRTIFLTPKLRRALLDYAAEKKLERGSVFVTGTGRALDRSNIWRDMKALCASAGVERGKVFPHNLRHLFARSFYAIEKDIFHLADILGHSSVETTRIYTITSGEEQAQKINSLGLVV